MELINKSERSEFETYAIYYWTFFMPVAVYIPTVLMTILGIRIRRDKLLTGLEAESRSLVMYFVRLFIVTLSW